MADDAIETMAIGEVARISAGYPLRTSAEELTPGDVPFVQLRNVNQTEGVSWAEVPRVTLPSRREPDWLSSGDVLFASRGTRMLAYPLSDVPERAVCGPQFFVITVSRTGSVMPEFLAWQINQRPAQDYLQREATGSYVQNVRKSVLEQLPVALPSVKKQRLIVAFWRAAQRERQIHQQLIEATEAQLDAIAIRLFTHTGATPQ